MPEVKLVFSHLLDSMQVTPFFQNMQQTLTGPMLKEGFLWEFMRLGLDPCKPFKFEQPQPFFKAP
jgi:hypothetical protein